MITNAFILVALLGWTLAANGGGAQPASTNASSMEAKFTAALTARGTNYETLEKQLIAGGADASKVLTSHLTDNDPVAKSIARCVLAMLKGEAPEFDRVEKIMENVYKDYRLTVMGSSPMIGLHITATWGTKPAECLALRLLKQQAWPDWKVRGVLEYLRQVKQPVTTALLLRYMDETDNPIWANSAIEALKEVPDPDISSKIALERDYMRSRGKPMNAEISALETKKP